MRFNRCAHCSSFTLLLSLLLSGTDGRADEASSIRQSLNAQRELLDKRGWSVSYSVSRSLVLEDIGAVRIQCGGENSSSASRTFETIFATKGDKVYWEHSFGSAKSGVEPQHSVRIFDGQDAFGQVGPLDYATRYGEASLRSFPHLKLPLEDVYREIMGFGSLAQYIPRITFRYHTSRLFDICDALASGVYSVDPLDPSTVRLSAPGDMVEIDTKRRLLMKRRWSWDDASACRAEIRVNNAKEIEKDLWFPVDVDIDYFGYPDSNKNKLVLKAHLLVSDVSIGVDDSVFLPKLEIGDIIAHQDTGRAFLVDEKSRYIEENRHRSSRNIWSKPVWVALASLAVLCLGVAAWKKTNHR